MIGKAGKVYSHKEACELIGCGIQTLHHWREKGRIAGIPNGAGDRKYWFYDEAEVHRVAKFNEARRRWREGLPALAS